MPEEKSQRMLDFLTVEGVINNALEIIKNVSELLVLSEHIKYTEKQRIDYVENRLNVFLSIWKDDLK